MTDDRDDLSNPPPEPVAPPPLAPPPAPPEAPPARATPWGWIVAGLLGLTLVVLAVLYFAGAFDDAGRRRPVDVPPVNRAEEAPLPPIGNVLDGSSGASLPAPAPAAGGGQVNAAWLAGGWGQACPGTNDPDVTFAPDGGFRLGADPGSWTLSGNIVTVTVNGRPQNSIMRWDYVSQDTARVTRVRTGDIYYVYRCPG